MSHRPRRTSLAPRFHSTFEGAIPNQCSAHDRKAHLWAAVEKATRLCDIRAVKRFFKSKPAPAELAVFMDPAEFSQVRAVLEAVAPRRCLEWGSGGSTRAILELCDFVETYVSVEHVAPWHEKVSQAVKDPRLTLHLVPPDCALPGPKAKREEILAWDRRAEDDASMMQSYVALPRTLGLEFDFVLVDGRARNFCMKEGFDLLRPGGVLVLHDAQRTEYHAVANSLGRAVFLEPFHQGQICIIRKP